jgi:4-amino-4-deoxy-L-arabinose transferase-like glycosyltransferase
MLIAFACLLPGFTTLQPMDRDESRFAQASKQMVESGDYVDIRFQDEARHKKPVGIYWVQSSVVHIAEYLGMPQARSTIWLYRIPSLIGALGAVLATYWASLAVLTRSGALLSALMLATSVLLSVEARLAKTDALLLLCITLTMGTLLRAYIRRDHPLSWLELSAFWGGMAAGILIKGPIVVMVAGLAALTLSLWERSGRWLKALKPFFGIIVTLILVSPWFIAIALKSSGQFFAESVGKDMLAKVGSGQEKHGAPTGFYLITFFATFWPSSIIIAMIAPRLWALRHEPLIKFGLAWIVPCWLIFEIVPTKLPHYILPLFPVIALVTVRTLQEPAASFYRWGTKTLSAFIWVIPLIAFSALSVFVWHTEQRLLLSSLPFIGLALILAFISWRMIISKRPRDALPIACLAAIPFSMGVFTGLPTVSAFRLSPHLAQAVSDVGCASPRVVTAGYREPSLVFLVGTDLAMRDVTNAAAFLEGDGCRIAFITNREHDAFQQALQGQSLKPELYRTITGFNKNGGQELDIKVYVKRD